MRPRGAAAVAFRLTMPSSEEEPALATLFELGTLGAECRPGASPDQIRLLAYFEDRPGLEADLRRALDLTLHVQVEPTPVPQVDWVARFRESFEPFAAGGFLIAPPWRIPDRRLGLRTLLVDPGQAFGTGTHETTRLCLAALESTAAAGPLGRVLDLGAGSGILAVAACLLGAAAVVAVDSDPDATASARHHARLNRVDFAVVLGDAGASFRPHLFDLVLANIQAPALLARREQLVSLCAPGGRLVLSGLLRTDLEDVRAAFNEAGTLTVSHLGEWAAVVIEPHRGAGR